jgi:hypothetical protein
MISSLKPRPRSCFATSATGLADEDPDQSRHQCASPAWAGSDLTRHRDREDLDEEQNMSEE